MALTPDNDVPLPGNIQAKDRIYPPVISLVPPFNAVGIARGEEDTKLMMSMLGGS